jgi:hypothetical protein
MPDEQLRALVPIEQSPLLVRAQRKRERTAVVVEAADELDIVTRHPRSQ